MHSVIGSVLAGVWRWQDGRLPKAQGELVALASRAPLCHACETLGISLLLETVSNDFASTRASCDITKGHSEDALVPCRQTMIRLFLADKPLALLLNRRRGADTGCGVDCCMAESPN
jgi:hypothetical protein